MRFKSPVLVLFIVLLTVIPGCTSEENSSVGEAIPAFSIVADDEVTYSSENLLGTPYIIHFSASWCNNCRPTIHAVDSQLSSHTYIVISTDDSDAEKLSDWHLQVNESQEGTVDTPFGAHAELAQTLDIKNTPTLLLVSSEGLILDRHIGTLTDSSEIDAFWSKAV